MTGRGPLSGAERQARYAARKKARKAAAGSGIQPDGSWVAQCAGQRPPFPAGHQLSLTTGASSPGRVLALAAQCEAALLADAATPDYLRTDTSHRPALRALCRAEAIVFLLTTWLDKQDVETAMTEFTEGEESESRPAPGAVKRTMRSRRVASVLDQIHKHDTAGPGSAGPRADRG